MDKSWITKPQNTVKYEWGHRCVDDQVICPRSKCGFRKWKTRDVDTHFGSITGNLKEKLVMSQVIIFQMHSKTTLLMKILKEI
ncbi:hypothetical protein CDL12_03504 [Handroanthus impetiginosus]|uniref:Uncharacterized protein n=1 Tax=Handroanthus impetiginosus TaxID=429701 RepID=A0A2G9I2D2_9LAMI|nr:hypothetical protein CDL12_03504 [Handroanthus impetiginosus]